MIDLSKLRVSLTKHGAHKVATLLRAFPKDQVLDNTQGTHDAIRIDRAQAVKNLSADSAGTLPSIWDEVKELEVEATADLVFLGIVFSHHALIEAMTASTTGELVGTIIRGQVIDGKAYTNFACVLDELGLATNHDSERVSYDLGRLFEYRGLLPLVYRLLALKLNPNPPKEGVGLAS